MARWGSLETIESLRWPDGARLAVCVVVREDCAASTRSAAGCERQRQRLMACAAQLPLTWVGGDVCADASIEHLSALPTGSDCDIGACAGSADQPGFRLRLDAAAAPMWDHRSQPPALLLPLDPDCADSRMLEPPWWTPDEWLQFAMDAFDCLHLENHGGLFGLCISPAGAGRSGAIQALQQLLGYIGQREQVWLASAGQIAAHCARVYKGERQCD